MDPDIIRDLFADLGAVRVRRMFGGQGIYLDELMFALEAGGELYLKADPETAGLFAKAGSVQFVYRKHGKLMSMSYWRLPDSGLDDPDHASRFGRLGVEAARRAALAKRPKGSKVKSSSKAPASRQS
jgi:DNA transformation protein and related proteins